MAGIFINYRRDDTPGVAGRLFDYLASRYSRADLFMDVDAMRPGMDFAKQLDTQVSQCRVLLAVIGPRWLEAKDKGGTRRLDNDKDYVRIELASALKRDIAVIPVLVDGATMPTEENLSDDLKPLARRHALELRHTRFAADADAIVQALEAVVPRRRMFWPLLGGGVAAVAAVAVIAALVVAWPKLKAKPAAPQPVVTAVAPLAQPVVLPPQPIAPPKPQVATLPPAPVAASPSAGSDAGLPAGIKLGVMMPNLVLRGSVLRLAEIAPDPAACQAACRAEPRCVSWVYTQPTAQDQPARCSLKAVIPGQFVNMCCTSGVERVPEPEMREPPPVPAGLVGALRGIELEGGTYRYFGGDEATPGACQAACRAEEQCLAWDYVRPGISTPDARCYLKNKSSFQVSSPCCIAGMERQAAASPAPVIPAPAPAPASGAMLNTNLFGSDYRNFDLAADDAALCQSACKADLQCLSWTYGHPGLRGPNAHCWLKNGIPQASANSCCTSGVERQAAASPAPASPAPAGGPMINTNLYGSDYRNFVLPADNATFCQSSCKADTQCLSWTYVRPGVQGPNARCWLKNAVPQATANSCCTSGIERPQVK